MSLVVRGAVTPASAGWRYIGFEVVRTPVARSTGAAEHCVVVLSGTCSVADFRDLGGRADPWSGMPDAVYLPPGTTYAIEGDAEVAICSAPARGGAAARVLPGDAIETETRGHGPQQRYVRRILMEDEAAESLLVSETLTP